MPGHSKSRLLPRPWPSPPEGTRGPPPLRVRQGREGTGSAQPAHRDGSRSRGETPGHHAGRGEDRKDGGLCPRSRPRPRPRPEGQPPARIPAASLRPHLVLRSSQAGSCETTTDALQGGHKPLGVTQTHRQCVWGRPFSGTNASCPRLGGPIGSFYFQQSLASHKCILSRTNPSRLGVSRARARRCIVREHPADTEAQKRQHRAGSSRGREPRQGAGPGPLLALLGSEPRYHHAKRTTLKLRERGPSLQEQQQDSGDAGTHHGDGRVELRDAHPAGRVLAVEALIRDRAAVRGRDSRLRGVGVQVDELIPWIGGGRVSEGRAAPPQPPKPRRPGGGGFVSGMGGWGGAP